MSPLGRVMLFGDALARSERVPTGLHGALSQALGTPVLDMTIQDGARAIYRRLPGGLREGMIFGPADDRTAILLVGAVDARGGGPAPAAFAEQVLLMCDVCADVCVAPLVVLAPSPPEGVRCPRGYGRGSRRWLARTGPVLAARLRERSRVLVQPTVPVEGFYDAVTLRPGGCRAVAQQVADALRDLGYALPAA